MHYIISVFSARSVSSLETPDFPTKGILETRDENKEMSDLR